MRKKCGCSVMDIDRGFCFCYITWHVQNKIDSFNKLDVRVVYNDVLAEII